MALGTNYARNPSPKAQERLYELLAKSALREGKTKEQFLEGFEPSWRSLAEKAWQLAQAQSA